MAIKIAGVDIINDDRELVLAKLTDIHKTENITAVDVFVYDTSKDSDGGAWRHRTQHTSWYAEASSASRDVNTRSTRAEFPSVAVIVAEADKVTIYDGDDPSLPMWMVISGGPDRFFNTAGSGVITSVSARNGWLVGATSTRAVSRLNFISEEAYIGLGVVSYAVNASIATFRNVLVFPTYASPPSMFRLVNAVVNDIAMTVLPDAPTDPATGLPVPTIAVATDGGVSVIKDDGNVWDIYNNDGANAGLHVSFTNDNKVAAQIYDDGRGIRIFEMPTADIVQPNHYSKGNALEWYEGFPGTTGSQIGDLKLLTVNVGGTNFSLHTADHNVLNIGTGGGLNSILRNTTTPANGMIAHTTSIYNTGWMNGDIKLAALADTTAETFGDAASGATVSDPNGDGVYDGEHVTNGGFATDISGWTDGSSAGGSIAWNSSGYLDLVNSTGVARTNQAVATVIGETYVATVEKVAGSSGVNIGTAVGAGASNGDIYLGLNNAVDVSETFVATSTTTYIGVYNSSTGTTANIDNVSIKLADADRSVNGNGLAVHGSITKAAVATGADVVGYSNFSSGNYLEQPYHSGIPDGTGQDIFITGWVHRPASNGTVVLTDFGEAASGKRRLFYIVGSTGSIAANNGATQVNPVTVPTDTWVQCGLVWYANDDLKFYINGQEVGTGTLSRTAQTQNNPLYIGGGGGIASNSNAKLALFRISATAPTADQIKKIYEDEKVLFQDNAKATLYGSSDAVTALAHDPATDLLHVGTSAGRSVFQGLRRVEESTGTESQSLAAISAVDGLVVEGK